MGKSTHFFGLLIEAVMTAVVRKLRHFILKKGLRRRTLPYANSKRSEKLFTEVYHDLYGRNRNELSWDIRRNSGEK